MCARAEALRPIAAIACSARSGGNCFDSSIRAHPRTAFKGVRISCDTVARNSSLRWLAVSASSVSVCARTAATTRCSLASRIWAMRWSRPLPACAALTPLRSLGASPRRLFFTSGPSSRCPAAPFRETFESTVFADIGISHLARREVPRAVQQLDRARYAAETRNSSRTLMFTAPEGKNPAGLRETSRRSLPARVAGNGEERGTWNFWRGIPHALTRSGCVMSTTPRRLLALSVVPAMASPVHADIGVIVAEPVSALGFFTRVGHVGTYLSNICPDGSPIRMRVCRPGESGGVVIRSSTLSENEDFDWAIVPFEEQAKGIFDLILPHATGDRTSGMTMQTPKGLAKALVSRALEHQELNLRVRRYPQVPGTFSRSRDVLFPMENTYRNIAFAPYWFWGGFREFALVAMFYHEVISPFDVLESSRDFMSARAADLTLEQHRLRKHQDVIRLALTSTQHNARESARLSALNASAFRRLEQIQREKKAEVAVLVLAAVIDHNLHQSDARREDIEYVHGLMTLFRQASDTIASGAKRVERGHRGALYSSVTSRGVRHSPRAPS